MPLPDDIDGPHSSSPSRPEDVGLDPHAHGEVGAEVTEQGREDADGAVGNLFGVEMALEEMLRWIKGLLWIKKLTMGTLDPRVNNLKPLTTCASEHAWGSAGGQFDPSVGTRRFQISS